MAQRVTILIIEDDPQRAHHIRGLLSSVPPYNPVLASSDISVRHVEGYKLQIAIVGASLGMEACMKCVQKLKIADPGLPILVFVKDKALTGGILNGPFEGIFSLGMEFDFAEPKKRWIMH